MATEDLTTYTKVDPGSKLTITAPKVVFTGVYNDDAATYLYSDKGVNYFSGIITHNFDVKFTSIVAGSQFEVWSLANALGSWYTSIVQASGNGLTVQFSTSDGTNLYFDIEECDAGTQYDSSASGFAVNTPYYLTVSVNLAAGTFKLYIYSDSGRTSLITSLSLTLHTTYQFRYIYAFQSYHAASGTDYPSSGFTENFDLNPNIIISVSDTIGMAEVKTLNIGSLSTDTISFSEKVSNNISFSIKDTISFLENISVVQAVVISVKDTIGFLESIAFTEIPNKYLFWRNPNSLVGKIANSVFYKKAKQTLYPQPKNKSKNL